MSTAKEFQIETDNLCCQSSELHLSWAAEDQKFVKDITQRGKHVIAVDTVLPTENKRQRNTIDAMKLLKALK